MLDEEKAGFVRSFMIELALTVRALYPDAGLQLADDAFINNPVERDDNGFLRMHIDNQLVIKRDANAAELNAIHDNVQQTLNCLLCKHHLVERFDTYMDGTLLEFYSDGFKPGYGEFCLAPCVTAKFKEDDYGY